MTPLTEAQKEAVVQEALARHNTMSSLLGDLGNAVEWSEVSAILRTLVEEVRASTQTIDFVVNKPPSPRS